MGVGGRDMSDAVGGMMMRECLRLLQQDDGTDVMVLISKPPGRATTDRLMQEVSKSSKPCVLAFLGADSGHYGENVYVEPTLEAATLRVLDITGGNAMTEWAVPSAHVAGKLKSVGHGPWDDQCFIRGLFSGGTLCYEALWLLRQGGLELHANVTLEGVKELADPDVSLGHTLVDLGDDRYTVGRPHPMIDFRPRCRRLLQEASDPEVGVVLMDVVLGYGSHADPASELGPAIEEAIAVARKGGRELACVVSLCGTDDDPQGISGQEERLTDAGAVVVRSNALAARIALGLNRRDLSCVTGG